MVCRSAIASFVSVVFVFVIAQVLGVPNAWAYEQTRTEYGVLLRLTSLPARVRLDSPVPGLSDGGQGALLRAIASWNGQACSSPVLVMTNEDDEVTIEIVPVVEHWSYGAAIAAHTHVESDPFQGDIRHVIIEIDARRKWGEGQVVLSDALDLESVFLHEFGHGLGLDHSRHEGAVMRAGIKPGQTRRKLDADDVAGLCAITSRARLGADDFWGGASRIVWQSKVLLVMIAFTIWGTSVVICALAKRIRAWRAQHRALE
jgi:Matrixin